MTKFLRFIYRLFFKNRIARLAIFLTLSVFGVKWATENLLGKKKTLFVKTILAINPSDINTFTIRQRDEELTFTRGTTDWLAVKNDVTVKIPEDSITAFLNLFGKMEAVALKKMPEVDTNVGDSGSIEKSLMTVDLALSNNATRSFSIFYKLKDSLTSEILSFVKLPNERLLHGVKGDLIQFFNKDFTDFRDKTLLDFSIKNVSKLEMRSRLDTVTFYAKDTNWVYSDIRFVVLQETFKNHVKSLEILRGSIFFDKSRDFIEPKNLENQCVIHTINDSTILTAYRLEKGFVLHSTHNNDAFFKVDSVTNIFPLPNNFVRPKPIKKR